MKALQALISTKDKRIATQDKSPQNKPLNLYDLITGRLLRFMKKKSIYNTDYEKFVDFDNVITTFFKKLSIVLLPNSHNHASQCFSLLVLMD